MPRRVCSLPQSVGEGRRQAGTSYCGCSRSLLRSSGSENRTTERPRHRAHSGGSRDQTASRMEKHRRPQPHVQKLLDPTEIPRCEERHTTAPLGIRRQTIKIAQKILPRNRVNDMLIELHGGPPGCHFGVNKTLDTVGRGPIDSRKETMSRSCAASRGPRTWNRAKCISTTSRYVRKHSHRCSRVLPTEQPRKPISPDGYGLFYEVAGSLRHSQSGGFNSNRSAS
jgi:hypothetical protein